MRTRNRTAEILEVRKRGGRAHEFLSFELERLATDWGKAEKSEDHLGDFYLIRAVTFLEVSTRRQVAKLIDHGPEYAERAVDFAKHFKADFKMFYEVQGRALTLGEVVAHDLPINDFGQVVSYYETLLAKSLRTALATVVDRLAALSTGEDPEIVIEDFDGVAATLNRLFEIRHILCHEVPKGRVYETSELDTFLDAACRFVRAVEELLTFEKFGLVPLTQTDMNIAARDQLLETEKDLEHLLEVIRRAIQKSDETNPFGGGNDRSWLQCFNDAQEKWLAYRNSHCEFVTFLNQGGTIRPLLWGAHATDITKSRIRDLQSWRDEEKERLTIFSEDGQREPEG